MGKLQAHEKRVNEIQEDAGAQTFFFQSKMVLDIPKRVEDMNKPKKVEQDANLEEEAMTASIV
jgi:hypothetical protein